MSYVVDWKSVCLVCLQKGDTSSIFQSDEDSELSIADKIMRCSDFKIEEGTDHPNNICGQCLEDLNVAFRFRQNCDQSNSIISAILRKENNELEIGDIRIKLPTSLNVKRVCVKSPVQIAAETPVNEEQPIKHEDDEFKTSDSETFDAGDYLDNTEVLEDEDDGIEEDVLREAIEEIHSFELIPELEELKPVKKEKDKDAVSEQTLKRGRGRPKIVFNRKSDPEYSPKKPGVTYQRALVQKNKSPHEPKPQKICEICGNSYKYQHALNSHMRRHRNERPFNCDFCEKAFVSAVELRRHMRVHTGQKPYACQHCDRRFSDYGSRIKHERTHTGERPYECSTCNKTFAYAHVLTVHMRTHTGEKKYMCNLCGRGFTKKAYLDNHLSHHNKSGTASEDLYETKEATANIVQQFDENMEEFAVPSEDVKPKEESDNAIVEGYHAFANVQ